jgi:hypothetical protein
VVGVGSERAQRTAVEGVGECGAGCSIGAWNSTEKGKDGMKGLKALAAVMLMSGLLVTAMPVATASAAAYKKYVGCGVSRNAKPAHVCPRKAKKGAFFRSFNGEVVYTVCVKFPSGKNLCAQAQKAEEDTLYVNKITSTIPGKHVVSWFVKGQKVGSWAFRVTG